ncbi:MAG: hypothetical protein GY847_14060 [Proteobacteria bacterium]|nr:hypothetical protein [Pseudomonadota bacterium]
MGRVDLLLCSFCVHAVVCAGAGCNDSTEPSNNDGEHSSDVDIDGDIDSDQDSDSDSDQSESGWFVAKYSPGGTLTWSKRFDDYPYIAALSDGSFLTTGVFSGESVFGAGEKNETRLSSAGQADIFITKHDPNATLVWAKRAGGGGPDESEAVIALPDGSLFVTGNFWGLSTFGPGETNETELSSNGKQDIFIAKHNPNGTLAWAKRAGGGRYNDFGKGVAALSDGSSIMTGSYRAIATFGLDETNETELSSSGKQDVFIAKHNPDGTLAWAKRAGGSDNDSGVGMAVLSDGSFLMTGSIDGPAVFGPGETSETELLSSGNYMAKHNQDGTLAWVETVSNDPFCSIVLSCDFTSYFPVLLSDGSVLVTGAFMGKAVIAKYDPDGTLAWARSTAGEGSACGIGIVALSDGSSFMAGSYLGASVFGLGETNETELSPSGEIDIFIARFSPDGTLVWAKSAGGKSFDYSSTIAGHSDGSLLITGVFTEKAVFGEGETNETELSSTGEDGIYIARYTPDGRLDWATRADAKNYDSDSDPDSDSDFFKITKIIALSDDSSLVTGMFY